MTDSLQFQPQSQFQPQGQSYPTYQYPNCGPWGITVSDQLQTASRLNTTFSQRSWADAKQNGCLPPPGKGYPKWPPPRTDGFVYPTLDKKPIELATLGESLADFSKPFANRAPQQYSGTTHQFWEAGQTSQGTPLDQAIGSGDSWDTTRSGSGSGSGSEPAYKDLSYDVAHKLALEMLGVGPSGSLSSSSLGEGQCHPAPPEGPHGPLGYFPKN